MEDFVFVDSYQKLCGKFPNLIHTTTSEIPKLFKFYEEEILAGRSPKEAVLVSSYDDAVIHEQASAHMNADLLKINIGLPWKEFSEKRDIYARIEVGPCGITENCNLSDKFSVKMDRWTWGTFPRIPPNIKKWFSTNLNIKHPLCHLLPFGLNNDGNGSTEILPKILGKKKGLSKKGLLYVNFQDNTVERIQLKNYFKKLPWVTYRDTANLPIEQFLDEVADHRFTLCPNGNGYDCYRTYEAISLGSIPILSQSIFSTKLAEYGLPILVANNFSFKKEQLEQFKFDFEPQTDIIKIQTWEKIFKGYQDEFESHQKESERSEALGNSHSI